LDLYAPSRFVQSRKFILEGPLAKAKSGRKLYVYLFNDLILFTQLKSNSARTMTKGAKYWVYRKVIYIFNEIYIYICSFLIFILVYNFLYLAIIY